MGSPFSLFTHMHTFENLASGFQKYIFLLALCSRKSKRLKKPKKVLRSCPEGKGAESSRAEQSGGWCGVLFQALCAQ